MKQRPLLWFFILTYSITWGLAALYFLLPDLFIRIFGEVSMHNPVFILAVWGPNIAAVIVARSSEGKGAVVRLLKSIIPIRTGIQWYLIALILIPIFGTLISLLSKAEFPTFSTSEIFSMIGTLIITGPLGEELGWRGFALPRLLNRYSATLASLILGVIWGLWHLPTFFTPGLPQAGLQIPLFILTALSISIIVTWIFIHTKGSVFLCFLLHFSFNFTATFIGLDLKYLAMIVSMMAILILVLYGLNLTKTPYIKR